MICFKNEHKSDQETYVALTRAFFTSLSPVRAALNYILAALLLAFGIYNLTAGETAWGIVMTACGLLLITLELAARFLTDYLDGDRYFKIRTGDHNLVRARNQIALAQDICRKMDDLREIVAQQA